MKDARAGRGAGNGHNENWYNAPIWETFSAKKNMQKAVDSYESTCDNERIDEQENAEHELKQRMKKLQALAY